MGFMNTFDTLRKCKASLIIKEIGRPCKENFTKVLMFKFDDIIGSNLFLGVMKYAKKNTRIK